MIIKFCDKFVLKFKVGNAYLSFSEIEREWLTTVSGAVHLGSIGQCQHIVTLHLVTWPGEVGSITSLQCLNFHAHD